MTLSVGQLPKPSIDTISFCSTCIFFFFCRGSEEIKGKPLLEKKQQNGVDKVRCVSGNQFKSLTLC